jgi:ankyrin repeat protein
MPKYTETNPLHLAVELGQTERVREMLHSGVKVDTRARFNVTALMVAAKKGNDELVQLLISAGANVNARGGETAMSEGKWTPLHYACAIGRVRTARILLQNRADPDAVDNHFETPLSKVLYFSNRNMAETLLEFGANPNGPEKCYRPPVVAAAADDYFEFVQELLAKGVDPNRVGESGETALSATTSVECARELLKYGADVNLKNAEGKTPILQKIFSGWPIGKNVYSGSIELLKLYVEAGADVNVKDKDNVSLLMYLTHRPDIKLAELLIGAGADVNYFAWPNVSIIDKISSDTSCNDIKERQELIEFLRSKGAKTAAELNPAGVKKTSSRKVAGHNRIEEHHRKQKRW